MGLPQILNALAASFGQHAPSPYSAPENTSYMGGQPPQGLPTQSPETMDWLQRYQQADDLKRKALGMQMPPPMHPNLTQFGIAALMQLIGGQGNAGQGFLGGVQASQGQQNEYAQQKYQNTVRNYMGQAGILEGQGEREKDVYNIKRQERQNADKLALDRDQFDREDATRRYGIDQGSTAKADGDRNKAIEAAHKVLGDPKTTVAARQTALQRLASLGVVYPQDIAQSLLQGTYYQAGEEAKAGLTTAKATTENELRDPKKNQIVANTAQANANAGLAGARAKTENATRQGKVADLSASTALKKSHAKYFDTMVTELPAKLQNETRRADAYVNRMGALNAQEAPGASKTLNAAITGLSKERNTYIANLRAIQSRFNQLPEGDSRRKQMDFQAVKVQQKIDALDSKIDQLMDASNKVPSAVSPMSVGAPGVSVGPIGKAAPPSARQIGGSAAAVRPQKGINKTKSGVKWKVG